jgi:hypothetical protein
MAMVHLCHELTAVCELGARCALREWTGIELIVDVDLFSPQPESLCLPVAGVAHYHVQQSNAFFFAGDPIGCADSQLTAMLADEVHVIETEQGTCQIKRHGSIIVEVVALCPTSGIFR